MGTNYYLHTDVCEHCGRSKEEVLHIGKSSAGWCFALHVRQGTWEEEIPANLTEWQSKFREPKVLIKNEYDEVIMPDEMNDIITKRSHPEGLGRHDIDGQYCIGRGDGTWDLCIGEFS